MQFEFEKVKQKYREDCKTNEWREGSCSDHDNLLLAGSGQFRPSEDTLEESLGSSSIFFPGAVWRSHFSMYFLSKYSFTYWTTAEDWS